MEKLLRPKEIADLLGVAIKTIYKWTCAGYIPHYKISGGTVRYKASVCEAWLKAKEKKGRLTYRYKV